ncbi:MAG: hypothetical protein P8L79_14160 [Rhodospirillaceae bacterium]|nr:hypothetical protein [Rhodospirillaceae bacterium]
MVDDPKQATPELPGNQECRQVRRDLSLGAEQCRHKGLAFGGTAGNAV